MFTGYWIENGEIYGPSGFMRWRFEGTEICSSDRCYTGYYRDGEEISGPSGYTRFYISSGEIHGPRQSLPWL